MRAVVTTFDRVRPHAAAGDDGVTVPDPAGRAAVVDVGSVRPWARFERRAMGSPLSLLVVGLDARTAEDAWRVASDDIEGSETTMSRFRPASELSRLCLLPGRALSVSPRLYRALAAARRAWRVTDGAFDPRVRSDLDRLGYAGAAVGDPVGVVAVEDRRSRPWLAAEPRRLQVAIAEPVDLGGIGKGLALRWAWHALVRSTPGIVGALLDAGGDMMLGGLPAQGDRWEIRIDDPMAPGRPLAAVQMGGGAISTSSSTMNRWAAPDGSVVHHLIDPRTGSPADRGILQVTVAGPDPAWTEVWCKVLYLAGAGHVEAEARRRGLAAWWVERDGTLRMTPLARLATRWTTRD